MSADEAVQTLQILCDSVLGILTENQHHSDTRMDNRVKTHVRRLEAIIAVMSGIIRDLSLRTTKALKKSEEASSKANNFARRLQQIEEEVRK